MENISASTLTLPNTFIVNTEFIGSQRASVIAYYRMDRVYKYKCNDFCTVAFTQGATDRIFAFHEKHNTEQMYV